MRTSVVVPYTAYLRVYEPLAAFSEPTRDRLVRAFAERGVAGAGELALAEQRADLAALLPSAGPVPPDNGVVYFADRAGTVLACPSDRRLRSWLSLTELLGSWPARDVGRLVPAWVVEQADKEFLSWRGEHPEAQPHIRTATWHVPLPWFVPFAPDCRVPSAGAERSVRYVTPMGAARRRVGRAYAAVRRGGVAGAVLEELTDVGRFLEAFHPHGLVELDYGGLVELADDRAWEQDTSVADVAAAVEAIGRGDGPAAQAAYERLLARWLPLRARGRAS